MGVFVVVEILWNDGDRLQTNDYDGTHKAVGETAAVALS